MVRIDYGGFDNVVYFKAIDIGEFFVHGIDLYIKINASYNSPNAVEVRTKKKETFKEEEQITKTDVMIVLKPYTENM